MQSTLASTGLFEKHRNTIESAIQAVHARSFFAHFPESPSKAIYGETAATDGLAAYESRLGHPFMLRQDYDHYAHADEVSPYTRRQLGITYPSFKQPGSFIARARKALAPWKALGPEGRAGILMESLERFRNRFFEMAHATMHTTGQTFVMSFQASGPHAADRALEAIALGYYEQLRFPTGTVEWVKPMGKFDVTMDKSYRLQPQGLSLCIGCSTFPVWNSLPGLYASLVTGNPVLVKPHPTAIYPLALIVQDIQEVLAENGMDVHVAQLVTDRLTEPVTRTLAESPEVKIIDFTGGNDFGNFLETLPGKILFTEKAGVNCALIDSVDQIKPVVQNLAFSLSMYSGQMCTAPQNVFIPKDGISTADGHLSYDEVKQALADAVKGIATHPQMGANVLGAIQSDATLRRMDAVRGSVVNVLLEPVAVVHPDFPEARLSAPLLLEATAQDRELIGKEWFGPIALVVQVENTAQAVRIAADLAQTKGAISCSAYVTDVETKHLIVDQMADAGVQVSLNFTGNFWVNQNAGFSDFHVTGGNPAGSGSLTDPAFIVRRFFRVGLREFKA